MIRGCSVEGEFTLPVNAVAVLSSEGPAAA